MIIKNLFDIDPAQWGTDTSSYFITGFGYWAKAAGANFSFYLEASSAGEVEIKNRVRTGSATNPTEYISGYKLEVNGVVVPMILDTTKPNDKRTEFGGSHVGYIKGKAKFNEGENIIKFTVTKQYGGLENMIEVIPPPEITQAQLDTMLKSAQETVKAGYEAIIEEKVSEATTASDAVWKAKFQLLVPTIPSLQAVQEVIKQVIG